jgi:hypothetical protein
MEYPSELPAAGRARIERAMADAETVFIKKVDEPVALEFFSGPHVFGWTGGGTQGDAAALEYVLSVGDTMIRTVWEAASDQKWPADQLRNAADLLLGQLIERAYAQKHSKRGTTLPTFITSVHEALRKSPSWAQLQNVIRDLSAEEEVRQTVSASGGPTIGSISLPPTPPPSVSPAALAESRKIMLADYKRATGVTKNKPIYECRRAGLHKPEFYKWLRGVLSPTSQITLNFERFLAEKRPPSPTD